MKNRAQRSKGIIISALIIVSLLVAGKVLSQQGYNLTYAWKAGDKNSYSVYVIGQISASDAPRQDVRFQYSDLWEVVSEDKISGLFKVVEKAENYSGTNVDLRSFGLPFKDEQVERTVDSLGRVAAVTQYAEASRFYLLPLVLADIPVRPGVKWKLTPEIILPLFDQKVRAKATIVYTLEDVNRNYKQIYPACARVRVDANYIHESEDGAGGVSGSFQGRIFFDLTNRKIVDYQISESRKEWLRADNRVRTTNLQVTSIARR